MTLTTQNPEEKPGANIPPQVRFREVRDNLLAIEAAKLRGEEIDLGEVQRLTNEAADLLHRIQNDTTGPRKKIDAASGETKQKKTKAGAKPKAASVSIMPVEDF